MLLMLCCGALIPLVFLAPSAGAQTLEKFSPEGVRFFESQVWPVLQEKCMVWHSDTARTSGLSLENREAILDGGNRGLTAVPGHPEQSRLVEAVNYQTNLKMPPGGRLADTEIAAISRWIELGMPWRTTDSGGHPRPASKDHWAFKPLEIGHYWRGPARLAGPTSPCRSRQPGAIHTTEDESHVSLTFGQRNVSWGPISPRTLDSSVPVGRKMSNLQGPSSQ